MPPPVRFGMQKYFFAVAALLALHGWTAVQHILPWTAFYNEWPFVAALLVVAIPALRAKPAGRPSCQVPLVALVPILLSLVPGLQLLTGQIDFLGDALMAALYLWLLSIAVFVGFRLDSNYRAAFIDALAIVIAIGALVSCVLASHQWLGLDTLGIWLVDMRPDGRVHGNLAQPNNLATLLSCGLVSAVYLRERGRLGTAATWVAALIFMAGIAMTRSRTALIIALVILAWLLLFRSRLAMRCSTREAICGFVLLATLWVGWPEVSSWLELRSESRLESASNGELRFAIWRGLLDAAFRQPLFGYGWNQVSVAQLSVAAEHPQSVFVEHSHNIVIDLLIWNGVLLGGIIVLAVGWWVFSRGSRIRSLESWFGLAVILVVGTHGMFELPLEYAYFLVPIGLCAGVVESRYVGAPSVGMQSWVPKTALATVSLVFAGVFVEYQIVEEDFRRMRFETAKIERRPEAATAQRIVLLTQVREYTRFARTEAREGMSQQELDWMGSVAHRFPFAPAMYRYALALALNYRFEAATLELARFQKLHTPAHYDEAIGSLEAMASRYPQLLNVTQPPAFARRMELDTRRDYYGEAGTLTARIRMKSTQQSCPSPHSTPCTLPPD